VRSLSPEEAELWARVTATISPLSREKVKVPHDTERPAQTTKPYKQPVPKAHLAAEMPPRPKVGVTLDGTWDRRLRSGNVTPDRILDLHGMTLDTAWQAIDDTLERAVQSRDRVILLVTGHHRAGEPPVLRGKIRAAVHDWLAASRHAGRIAAVRGAHRRHGGGGSLYLILRR